MGSSYITEEIQYCHDFDIYNNQVLFYGINWCRYTIQNTNPLYIDICNFLEKNGRKRAYKIVTKVNPCSITDNEILDIKLPDNIKIVGTFLGFVGTRIMISENIGWIIRMRHTKEYELEKDETYKFTGSMETLSSCLIVKIKKANLIELGENIQDNVQYPLYNIFTLLK